MKQGYGEMRYANGDVYEGEWLRDTKCGHGKMSWKSSKQEFTGQWRDNMPNGLGTHVWFQQVSEKTDANHALLLMYNRWVTLQQAQTNHNYVVPESNAESTQGQQIAVVAVLADGKVH